MRTTSLPHALRSRTACLAALLVLAAACGGGKAPVAVTPVALDDSSAAALKWVDQHAVAIPTDSQHVNDPRAIWAPIVRDVRILGVSELNEGTHEFLVLMRHLALQLGRDFGYRGVAIQAPMAETMNLDRYVRSGVGNPKRIVRTLGAVQWERQEVIDLLDSLRAYNQGRAAAQQIGFYGFENPTLRHAVNVIDSLPASAVGASRKSWLASTLRCIATGEGANWGREGLASDTTFWTHCGVAAAAVVDTLRAARAATRDPVAVADIAFAEQMARLIHHGVVTGLRRLSRPEVVAEHVLFVESELGGGKLLVWGLDYEAGRIELDKSTIQMAVPLTKRIGQQYHALAFTFGEGSLRARPIATGPNEPGERDMKIQPPLAGTFENVFNRAQLGAYLLDMRQLTNDMAGKWLGGPRPMRVITGQYSPLFTAQLQHDMELPRMYDGVLFVKNVTPATKIR